MKISELFYSIQGEGKLVGVPSVFVRASGCNLRCSWCFVPETPVLRPDWSWTPIGELSAGDHVLARTLPRKGKHGGLTVSRVVHVARRVAPLVRVNDEITCTPDHKFWLTGKGGARSGWREISRCVGLPVSYLGDPPSHDSAAYELGYLAGMANGDGTFWTPRHRRGYRRFRLALKNELLLERYAACAERAGVALRAGPHSHTGFTGHQIMPALWLTRDAEAKAFEQMLAGDGESDSWAWGYLGGIIDAEGSLGGRALRVSQYHAVNPATSARIGAVLDRLRLRYSREENGYYIHSSGGQLWRVLSHAQPSKSSIIEGVLERAPNTSRIIETIEPLGHDGEVVTLTTTAGSYIAAGYVVKNCDTPYASWNPEGENQSVPDIVRQVEAFGAKHVVLTGGEPMIMPDIEELCAVLKANGHHITIETAATVFKPVAMDLASLSPKLSNSTPWDREGGRFADSHERQRLNFEVIQQFIDAAPDFQLKFVVADQKDLDELRTVLDKLKGWQPADVLLMPEGTDRQTLASRAGWIGDVCKSTGFRYCPRLHVELYGNKRGT